MPSRTRKPVVNTRPRSELAVAIIIGLLVILVLELMGRRVVSRPAP